MDALEGRVGEREPPHVPRAGRARTGGHGGGEHGARPVDEDDLLGGLPQRGQGRAAAAAHVQEGRDRAERPAEGDAERGPPLGTELPLVVVRRDLRGRQLHRPGRHHDADRTPGRRPRGRASSGRTSDAPRQEQVAPDTPEPLPAVREGAQAMQRDYAIERTLLGSGAATCTGTSVVTIARRNRPPCSLTMRVVSSLT